MRIQRLNKSILSGFLKLIYLERRPLDLFSEIIVNPTKILSIDFLLLLGQAKIKEIDKSLLIVQKIPNQVRDDLNKMQQFKTIKYTPHL